MRLSPVVTTKDNRWQPRKFLSKWNLALDCASTHRLGAASMQGSHFGQRDGMIMPLPSVAMPRVRSDRTRDIRVVAEECPVALVYDGTSIAVLMATPAELADLALGFSLTECIIREAAEIQDIEVVPGFEGV